MNLPPKEVASIQRLHGHFFVSYGNQVTLVRLTLNKQLKLKLNLLSVHNTGLQKKIKLKVVYNFLAELGVFCTTKIKNETHFSQSGQVFFSTLLFKNALYL